MENHEKKMRLGGAKFGLFNKCGEKVAEGTTNCDGELCFEDLPLGEYLLKELCPPPGFCPCGDEHHVHITCDDRHKCITVINKKVRGSIKIIKFGEK